MQSSSSEKEDIQVEVTRLLVESYFDLVRKNLQDAVPKAIMHFLVLYVQRGLQQRLIRSLYRYSFCQLVSSPASFYIFLSTGACNSLLPLSAELGCTEMWQMSARYEARTAGTNLCDLLDHGMLFYKFRPVILLVD